MTALTVQPMSVGLDPLRDLTHREARAARELADWLAGLELIPMATRTLDAYENVGHESLATTEDIYSHPDMDDLGARVRELVGGAL